MNYHDYSFYLDGPAGWAFTLGLVAVYFVPTIIAFARSHYNKWAIFILNILLGWTAIGWIVALVWSFTNPSIKTISDRAWKRHLESRGKTTGFDDTKF